ncbi:hypothetical protein DSL72_000182 [Monilinia vaccinii-corymbosi]|uniref:Uncharacterized protein n=1 Tax=Monilinia vaccinii-corymbosi TaxID=61207 RepID=A0A8A3NY78_9HELO|nr:hypothetical protein DSL72_000182 [Monilinia vaccinii-corymbosi]
MPPRTVFPLPGNLILLNQTELDMYTRKYNWVVAMQQFKATRTWPEVLAQYHQFPLGHLDGRGYTNWGSIRDKLSYLRRDLSALEKRHDFRAAGLVMNVYNSQLS